MSANSSNVSYSGPPSDVIISFFACNGIVIILGALLNVWFMGAILTSPDIRSLMRNKLIVNMTVAHLINSLVIIPLHVGLIAQMLAGVRITCYAVSAVSNLQLIEDFVGNWIIVILLAFFIANISDYDPTGTWTPRGIILATAGVLVLPWIASLITVPAIMTDYHSRRQYLKQWTCIFPTLESWQVFRSLDTVVPLLIAIILISIAGILRWLRFAKGAPSGVMRRELIGRGREIDSTSFYVIIVGVAIVCDAINMMFAISVVHLKVNDYETRAAIEVSGLILGSARGILMPIPWLLLPDVRQRIKTWRPWYRPAPGIDLRVTYSKDAE